MFGKKSKERRTSKKSSDPVRSCIEPLEQRTMMSGDPDTLNLTLTGGSDTVYFDVTDYDDPEIGRYLRWSINGKSGSLQTPFIYHVNIFGMGGNDDIDIVGLKPGMEVNVYSLAGNDSVNVVEDSGRVNFHGGGGSDKVYVNGSDFEHVTNTFYLEADRVAYGDPKAWHGVFWDSVETLNFYANPWGDTVNIDAVPSNMSFNVRGAEGNDTFIVGAGDIDSNIKGGLSINGWHQLAAIDSAIDTVIFDDTKDAGGDVNTLKPHNFTKSSMNVAPYFGEIENVVLNASDIGGDYINITGADAKSIKVYAGGGNDQITVGDGNLKPFGYTQLTLDGGAGNDLLIADDHSDTAYEKYRVGPSWFDRTSVNQISDPYVEVLSLRCSSFDNLVDGSQSRQKLIVDGAGGNDTIIGSKYDDILRGGIGHDSITAGDGNDWMDGGTGADVMYGGAGTDTVDYSSRTKAVFVDLNVTGNDGELGEWDSVFSDVEIIKGGAGNDVIALNTYVAGTVYGNGGNDTITGGNQPDNLFGGAGNDLIKGLGGGDWLIGGAGSDKLAGGAGDDALFANDGEWDLLDGGIGVNNFFTDVYDAYGIIR